MADDDTEVADPEVDKLVSILQKDEDERQDDEWDALAAAEPAQLQAAATKAGVTLE